MNKMDNLSIRKKKKGTGGFMGIFNNWKIEIKTNNLINNLFTYFFYTSKNDEWEI